MNLTFDTLLPSLAGLFPGLALLGYLFYTKKGISAVRMIIWLVWAALLFAVLGFIAVKTEALPYRFLIALLGSVLLGTLYLILAPITLEWWKRPATADVFLTGLVLIFFGISCFSITYVLLSGSAESVFYLIVALSGFLLPSLIVKSYDLWMLIPDKKYRTWKFPIHQEVPRLQPVDPIRLTMNFTPVPSGKNEIFESYEVEFPTNESLSDLFHYFISFHNKHREYRKKPIQYLNGEVPLEWILYKYSPQKKKLFLDMDKTLIENQVTENENIYALSMN